MRRAVLVATDSYDDPAFTALGAPLADARELQRVLADPGLGGFDHVDVFANEPSSIVAEGLEQAFVDAAPTDLLLVYLSGHGVRDSAGRLHFATRNTVVDRLRSTSVPASMIHHLMDDGPRSQIVIVDCCYSGAFAAGMVAKGDAAGVGDELARDVGPGRGRVVLTASDRIQYALEQKTVRGPTSLYTGALVDGIASGTADLDGDGWITADEIHDHAVGRLRELDAPQTPQRWSFGTTGDLRVARAGASQPWPTTPLTPRRRRRPGRRIVAAVGAVVIAVVAAIGIGVWTGGDEVAAAPAQGTYLATVSGSAAGGATFEVTGELRIAHGASDGARICLAAGDPLGAPESGAIWFGTVDDCFGAGEGVAVAEVVTDRGEIRIRPIATWASAENLGTHLNRFTVSDSLTAQLFVPDDGEIAIAPEADRRISGTINLRGLPTSGGAGSANYTATLTASRVSDDPDAVVSNPDEGGARPVAPAPVGASRYAVATVLTFEVVEGDGAFADEVRSDMAEAVFVVGEDTFTYAPPGGRDDLYPLEGTVTDGGGGLAVLSGSATVSDDTFTTTVTAGGTLDLTGGSPMLSFTLRTEAGGRLETTTGTESFDRVDGYSASLQLVER